MKKEYTRKELIRFEVSKVRKGKAAEERLMKMKVTHEEWDEAVQELKDYAEEMKKKLVKF